MIKRPKKYSVFSLVKNAFSYHENWQPAWRNPEIKKEYDAIIVGGGGHGLTTAFYLAKNHGIKNIAVVEKGWIGGGNTGRNTTIIRSNYLWDQSAAIYDHALKLWEGMSQELNYNVMFSQRGVMNVAHNLHDAVAWGYARGADAMGVDIIQNCEVTGINIINGNVTGIETTKGSINSKKIGIVAAGHSSVIAKMAGIKLPLESRPLQALVSEPVKPIIDTVVMSNTIHAYVSQSDKGELVIGAGTDGYNSYSQRGGFNIVEDTIMAIVELFPLFSRMKMLRHWGGIVDICPDASPIISKTHINGLYFNCGWGTGGFKATPGSGWVFAHTIANDQPHALNAPFSINRFSSGELVDEHGAAAVAH